MYYDMMLTFSNACGLDVAELPLTDYDGLIMNCRIGIRKGIRTNKERGCVLAEEIGHYRTSAGDILNYNDPNGWKQEVRARAYAYDFMIGMANIVGAWLEGCRNIYEMAEFLDCTEDFLQDALNWYHEKYGISTKFGSYTIYFEPCLDVKTPSASGNDER